MTFDLAQQLCDETPQSDTAPAPRTAPPGPALNHPNKESCSRLQRPTPAVPNAQPKVALTFLPKRRIRLAPSPPELDQILVRVKNFLCQPEKAEFEDMFKRQGEAMETDLGFLDRILREMARLGMEIEATNWIDFPAPERGLRNELRLTPRQREAFDTLMRQVGGGYLYVSKGYNTSPIIAAIAASFAKRKVLISLPDSKRLKEVQSCLQKGGIRFEGVRGKTDVPQRALTTHELLKQIPSDSADVLVVEQAHLVSGLEFQKVVRRFGCLKFGVTNTTSNAKEDKAMLLEGIFGPEVSLRKK